MGTTIAMATFGSPCQLLIIALLVVLIFGTKKLRSLGSDLGESLKNFKKAMSDDHSKTDDSNKAEKQHTDADFEPKNITEKTTSQTKEAAESKKNKE
uniref:Sec-independent protein translocase protein TatA n=1 Tax=Arsenophonus endosymbiont of Trialeurodes vaporariorum TaxID=235567 RepID=A0A3B0LWV4_9GAMM